MASITDVNHAGCFKSTKTDAEKYRAIKVKMHLVTYGSKEYRTMQKLMNFYYGKIHDGQ